ncbi:MAG: CehA/McbA family metallohydrolase [bacterium]|nr:CehA/McbA family metallohydrolase [bacterium]
MKKHIIQTFTRKDQYKRFEVPFRVPIDTDIIDLKFNVINNTNQKAIIDIGLKDAAKVRGWSGGSKKQIIITEEYATPGYRHGDIKPGVWNILLSIYKAPETGCSISIDVTLKEKTFRWLKGDTHLHSVHSDGQYTVPEIINLYKEYDFDYLITTDHNTYTQNMSLPSYRNIIVIPGMELTTYRGHANFIGIKKPIEDFRCNCTDDVSSRFIEAKKNGCYTGINHPFADDNDGCMWNWGFDLPFDWIEIWNRNWSYMNQNALDWWHNKLCEGKKIPIIGGSDNHKSKDYNNKSKPVTHVYVDSLNRNNILEGFKNGNVFISSIDGPLIDMKTENNILGESTEDSKVNIKISNLFKHDKVMLLSDNGEEKCVNIVEKKLLKLEFCRLNQKFIRVEISRYRKTSKNFEKVLLTNPIYFK